MSYYFVHKPPLPPFRRHSRLPAPRRKPGLPTSKTQHLAWKFMRCGVIGWYAKPTKGKRSL